MALKKMKPEYKERWLKALRGKGYRQGAGSLRVKTPNTSRPLYCCLGVLVNIDEDLKWETDSGRDGYQYFSADGTNGPGELDTPLLKRYGLSQAAQNHLIAMNDGGEVRSKNDNLVAEYDMCSFKQIADWIEENL